jgi:hypothetical protein
MKWTDKIENALVASKDVVVGTFNKVAGVFGYEFDNKKAVELVDHTTDALAAVLSTFVDTQLAALRVSHPELALAIPKDAIVNGAITRAFDHVDAVFAGVLAAKGK